MLDEIRCSNFLKRWGSLYLIANSRPVESIRSQAKVNALFIHPVFLDVANERMKRTILIVSHLARFSPYNMRVRIDTHQSMPKRRYSDTERPGRAQRLVRRAPPPRRPPLPEPRLPSSSR